MCKTRLGRGIWSAVSGLCWLAVVGCASLADASILLCAAVEAGVLITAVISMRKAGWYIGQRDWGDR